MLARLLCFGALLLPLGPAMAAEPIATIDLKSDGTWTPVGSPDRLPPQIALLPNGKWKRLRTAPTGKPSSFGGGTVIRIEFRADKTWRTVGAGPAKMPRIGLMRGGSWVVPGKRASGPPKLKIGVPDIQGHMSVAAFKQRLMPNATRLSQCVRQAAAKAPNLAGRVDLRLAIGPTGRVMSVGRGRDTLENRGLVHCFEGVLRGLAFPAPAAGGAVRVTLPLSVKRR